MKKLLSASIAAVLCAVTFCTPALAAENSEAMDLYQRSIKAMENISSMEMVLDDTITATIEVDLTAKAQQVMRSATNADLAMKIGIDLAGTQMNMYTYYKDGVMYQNAMGQKTAAPMDMASALEATSGINSFGTEHIKSITATTVMGGTRLDIIFEAEAINDMIAQVMSSVADAASDVNMTFSDLRYTMLLDENGITKNYRIVMEANITAADSTVSMVCDLNCDITSVDKVFDIQFPDFSEYTMQDPVIAPSK